MPVANLRLRVTSHWVGGDGDDSSRRLSDGVNGASNGIRRAGDLIGRVGRIFGRPTMLKGVIALAPAMFTFGKAALALAGGALALGAVVSAAVAPWVGLAYTAAKNADRMGPAGRRFIDGANAVGNAWMALAKATAPETLGPLTDVLKGITAAIPKLEPLVRDVAPSFAQMARDIKSWLSGNGFERFLDNIRTYGVPAFRNLAAAGRDILPVIGQAFRDFAPLARDIATTIRGGARSLADWGKGGGFRRFLDGVKQEWPTVREALKQVGRFMGNLARVLDSAGTGGLGALSTLLGLMNSIDPRVLRDILLGYATGRFIIGLAGLLAAIAAIQTGAGEVQAAGALTGSAGELGAAGLTLLAMAASISQMARRQVSEAVNNVRNAAGGGAVGRIKDIWKNLPKNTTATAKIAQLDLSAVAMMGVYSTWSTVEANFLGPALFKATLDQSQFLFGRTQIIFAWAGVKVQAANVPNFTATASPGNVPGAASQIVSAWQRVRNAAASPARFSATGNVGNVVGGSNQIVSAWRRVTGMPKSWSGSARASAGSVPGVSSRVVSSWRQLYSQARSWSGVAICSFSGGGGGGGGIMGGIASGGGGGGGGGINWGFGQLGDEKKPNGLGFVVDLFEPEFDKTQNGIGGDLGLPQYDDEVQGFFDDLWGHTWDVITPDIGGGIGDAVEKVGDWLNPFATGGTYAPVGRFAKGVGGGAPRVVDIYDDIRVRNVTELADVIEEALGG